MDGEAGNEQETAKRNGVLPVGTSDELSDIQKLVIELEWEGKFLLGQFNNELEKERGRTYLECARRIAKIVN